MGLLYANVGEVVYMAVTIGLFHHTRDIAVALDRIQSLGVLEYNVALLELGQHGPNGTPSLHVSGYLEHDAREGEIRTIEEGVYLALSREGFYTEDMVSWLQDVQPGNGVLVVRSQPDVAPWISEAFRRAGARIAVDSESQGELVDFANRRRWQPTDRQPV